MKPIVYFFGSLPNGFSSYPQDHTKQLFEDFLKRAKNESQIVLHRKDNLLYYGYVRKFNNRDCLGICVCLDCIYCDIPNLFAIFDNIVANAIQTGDILAIQSHGKIAWAINKFTEETVSLIEYTEEIIGKLDLTHKTIDLPPTDFSISVNDCLDISLEEDASKIIDASKRYSNLYIVKANAEIARVTSFYNIVLDKEKKIANLKSANTKLQVENEKIQRQKENFKRVTFLAIALVLCMIIGAVIYNKLSGDIEGLHRDLDDREITINNQKRALKSKQDSIQNYIYINGQQRQTISKQQTRISEQDESITNLQNQIQNLSANIPLTNVSFKFSSGYLSFKYSSSYGHYRTLKIRVISPDGSYNDYERQIYFYQGTNNTQSCYITSSLNSSRWYTFNIYYNGNIIGGGRF